MHVKGNLGAVPCYRHSWAISKSAETRKLFAHHSHLRLNQETLPVFEEFDQSVPMPYRPWRPATKRASYPKAKNCRQVHSAKSSQSPFLVCSKSSGGCQ